MGYWEEKANYEAFKEMKDEEEKDEMLKSLFCNNCGKKIGNKSAKCKECEEINCRNCYSLCKKCRKSTCRECLEEAGVNPKYCIKCGDEICSFCDKKASKSCKKCKRNMCEIHIKGSSSGFFCVNYYCKDCV